MVTPFQKIGLAVTFSPTGKILLEEANRLRNLFNSKLVLIHIGEKSTEIENRFYEKIKEASINKEDVQIVWRNGDPAKEIIRTCESENIDLLIAGALEKETIVKYYIGSVARKIMKESISSVLILKSPIRSKTFKKIYVLVEYSSQGEKTIKIAHQLTTLENADEFVLVKDFFVPGLTATLQDTSSYDKFNPIIEKWKLDEEEKVRFFINELNLKGINYKIKCLYGKKGWESRNYVKNNNADLFILPGQKKRLKLFDAFFPSENEYIYEELPSNLLIIK
ncbi:MAG: hypothetical protein STSR0008_06990 [Ignavibacterium sp.]